jgi:hypothetical protein
MSRKPRFKPQITRVKLNPEQAVLSCNCYSVGTRYTGFTANAASLIGSCKIAVKQVVFDKRCKDVGTGGYQVESTTSVS